jgi:phosphatidylglycerol:prolipoprotein diacylglycerol transferase
MYPYLIHFVFNGHAIKIPSYGIMLALGFTLAYFESLYRAKKIGEPLKHIENLFLIIILGAILGARLFHVLFEEFDYYRDNPSKIIAVWEGGYTFYGGLITCIVFIYWYCRKSKIVFFQFADIAAGATALALSVGRVGCFLTGCCWGREAHVPWSVTFTHPETFTSVRNIPLHPTQLYESLGALGIYFYLLWLWPKRKYQGQLFFHGIALYAIVRFIVELYRGDDYRGYVFGGLLSYSQVVSLTLLPFALLGMFLFRKRPIVPPLPHN